mmetsp:Transcript_113945/g.322591  ORF Transcript_113945/g.322591 Transcript_113945/m.322591 type:complete len:481 (-) Transcript_113945:49-1491(-)
MAEEDAPEAPQSAKITAQFGGDDEMMGIFAEGWCQVQRYLEDVDPALGEKTGLLFDEGFVNGMNMENLHKEALVKCGITDEALIKKLLAKRDTVQDNEWYMTYINDHGMDIHNAAEQVKHAAGGGGKEGKLSYADKWGVGEHDRGLFGKDGIWLTACGCDNFLFLWPADHPDPCPPCVRCVQPHINVCTDSCTDFGRMQAVTVGLDCKVVVTDLEAGKKMVACRTDLKMDPENGFLSVDADFDAGKCAVGTAGKKGGLVKVFDLQAQRQFVSLKGARDDVYSVKADFDLNQVVAGSWDHNLYTFDIRSGKCTRALRGHGMNVNEIQVDFEQQVAVSVADEDRMILWDLAVGGIIKEYPIQCQAHALDVDFRTLRAATGSGDGRVRFWDLESAECTKVIDCEFIHVQSLDIYWDFGLVAAASWDYQVKLFDYHSGRCFKKFRKARRTLNRVEIKKTGGSVPMDRDGAPLWHLQTPNPYEAA